MASAPSTSSSSSTTAVSTMHTRRLPPSPRINFTFHTLNSPWRFSLAGVGVAPPLPWRAEERREGVVLWAGVGGV